MRALLCLLTALPLAGEGATLSPGALKAANGYSASHGGMVLVIRQQGRLVHEWYSPPAGPGRPVRIYSGTKGFWALAALAAHEDGILALDARVADIIPEWKTDPKKSRVTLRQLLDFSAGLREAGSLHNDGWKNRNLHALGQPILGEPDRTFIYGPAAMQVYHEALRRRLDSRHITPTQYLERRVLRAMALGPQRYLPDAAGHPLLAAGFIMKPAEWMRIGDVWLRDGKPVLRSQTLRMASQGSLANPMFGLGFWNNRLAPAPSAREIAPEAMLEKPWHQQDWRSGCLCRRAPPDLIASAGSGGQRLYIVPSLDLMILRHGRGGRFSDADFLDLLFR
jgi:CubicO group peptidase (beta-lactamase class C family)